MTTEQLQYFVSVVEKGSCMEAALELNISQSTVSKQIQILERELGVALFNRSSRKATLTDEGQKLLPQVKGILEKVNQLFDSASKLKTTSLKRFKILALPFIGFFNFYPLLSMLRSQNPDLQPEVVEVEEPQLTQSILLKKYDLALTYEYEYRHAKISDPFCVIADDELILAVHKEHPLVKCRAVTLDDIGNTPLLLMGKHTGPAKICEEYFAERNFTPNIVFRGHPETLLSAVNDMHGCAILSKKQVQNHNTPNIATLPFAPRMSIKIIAVMNDKSDNPKAIEQFVRLLIGNL